jgi:acyl CoA:acetate/3-ketoacid CoA transferase beta subunit
MTRHTSKPAGEPAPATTTPATTRPATTAPATTGAAWSPAAMMTVAAARELAGAKTCFVGIGLPSTAANLARRVHNTGLVLIYESGTLGAKPTRLPLSIGDGELADTADAVVGVPEIFNYWLQAGRIDVGFLSAAQLDRFANLNTTAISRGDGRPELRLPGAGGAPEIAAHARRVLVVVQHRRRTFVPRLDYVTTVGHGSGPGDRERLGLTGAGPVAVITDLGVLRPDPQTRELTLVALHPGVELKQVLANTGWPLRVADRLDTTTAPQPRELQVLHELEATLRDGGDRDAGA